MKKTFLPISFFTLSWLGLLATSDALEATKAKASSKSSTDTLAQCQLAHPLACHDCITRVEASCLGSSSNQSLNGALEAQVKPLKVEVKISNSKNGSERIISVNNSTATVSELNNELGLKKILRQGKIELGSGEKAEIASIWIPTTTALYKATQGQKIAGQLKSSAQRSIASENASSSSGSSIGKISGIRRALETKTDRPQKKEGL